MTLMHQDLAESAVDERLKRLLSYAAADPANAALRTDAAEQALEAGEPDIVPQLMKGPAEGLSDRDLNLLGVAQMQLRDFGQAASAFEGILSRGVDEPAVKFNLAWSLAMGKQFDRALDLLTPGVTSALPQAAMLHVQLLHDRGAFDQAAELARDYLEQFPGDAGLAAAVSVLALDVEDIDLARQTAMTGGDHPDALTTLGTLALGDQDTGAALQLFDRALAANAAIPRAWVGRGLAQLISADPAGAGRDIDKGAELFKDHIGSWIAAGWAYLIAGNLGEARNRFERALAIDDNFAESHGSLAVVDVLEGQDARTRIGTALRLDRQCFSAAFAQTLTTAREGRPEAARAIFEKILKTPVNDRGDTAAQAIARLGLR